MSFVIVKVLSKGKERVKIIVIPIKLNYNMYVL